MTLDEFRTWQMVFTLCAVTAAGAYAVLILQCLFHERRIAIVGLFGGLACAALAVVAGGIYPVAATVAGLLFFGFTVYSMLANIRQAKFWVPLVVFLVAAPGAGSAYWYIHDATAPPVQSPSAPDNGE